MICCDALATWTQTNRTGQPGVSGNKKEPPDPLKTQQTQGLFSYELDSANSFRLVTLATLTDLEFDLLAFFE